MAKPAREYTGVIEHILSTGSVVMSVYREGSKIPDYTYKMNVNNFTAKGIKIRRGLVVKLAASKMGNGDLSFRILQEIPLAHLSKEEVAREEARLSAAFRGQ